jgi:hypothetical protein
VAWVVIGAFRVGGVYAGEQAIVVVFAAGNTDKKCYCGEDDEFGCFHSFVNEFFTQSFCRLLHSPRNCTDI